MCTLCEEPNGMTSVRACIKVRIMEENLGVQPPQKTVAERQRDYRAREKIKYQRIADVRGVPLKDVMPKRIRKPKFIGPKPLPKSPAERQKDRRARAKKHFEQALRERGGMEDGGQPDPIAAAPALANAPHASPAPAPTASTEWPPEDPIAAAPDGCRIS